MRALPGGALYPEMIIMNTTFTNIYVAEHFLDSGEKIAFKMFAPKDGTIDKFEFRLGASGATATNGIKVSFQGVSATTGKPDGVISAYRTVSGPFSANQWVVPGLMTSDGTDSGTKLSVTRGQEIFVVIEYAGAFVGGNFIAMGVATNNAPANLYYSAFQFGVWTNYIANAAIGALKYDDGSYPALGPVWPFKTLASASINTGTNPDEAGMRFAFPTDLYVSAVRFRADIDNDCELRIYDSQYNLLHTLSLDKDKRYDANEGMFEVPFPSDVAFAANEYYLAVLRPTSASSIGIPYYTVNDSAMLSFSAGGNLWHWVERQNDGTWAFIEDRRPFFQFRIVGIPYAPNGWEYDG